MKVHLVLVDAFTRTPGEGNRAGVVPSGAGLDEATMQAVARAVGASETAFVLPGSPGATLRLRYFTPAAEVDFCGHATVATLHYLAETGVVAGQGRYTVDFAAGRLDVELEPVEGGVRVWIATPRSPWTDSPIEAAELMRLVGGDTAMLDPELPIRRSGIKLFIPIARRQQLWSLAPRFGELAQAGKACGVLGFMAFTREVLEPGSAAHSRFFAPALGVREDPVTGAANGPLGAYLALHGVLRLPDAGGTVRARAEQGDAMGKPGRVELEVRGAPGKIETTRIGGVAVSVMTGELALGELALGGLARTPARS